MLRHGSFTRNLPRMWEVYVPENCLEQERFMWHMLRTWKVYMENVKNMEGLRETC